VLLVLQRKQRRQNLRIAAGTLSTGEMSATANNSRDADHRRDTNNSRDVSNSIHNINSRHSMSITEKQQKQLGRLAKARMLATADLSEHHRQARATGTLATIRMVAKAGVLAAGNELVFLICKKLIRFYHRFFS
jgi:hypothetical protein